MDNYENYAKIDEREALEGDAPRVLRGGSWGDYWGGVRCAGRFRYLAHYRDIHLGGFRVCVSASSLTSRVLASGY